MDDLPAIRRVDLSEKDASMSDVNVTVTGFVGQDPVLYTSNSGNVWTSFSVASTRRVRDSAGQWSDGATMWFRVKAFGDRARNAVKSLHRGTPVTVTGRLAVEEYVVTKQGSQPDSAGPTEDKRVDLVVENATIAVDITRGTVDYSRTIHTEDSSSLGQLQQASTPAAASAAPADAQAAPADASASEV